MHDVDVKSQRRQKGPALPGCWAQSSETRLPQHPPNQGYIQVPAMPSPVWFPVRRFGRCSGRLGGTHSSGLPSGPFLNWCLLGPAVQFLSTFCVFEEELGAAWRSVHMALSAALLQQPKLKTPAGPVPRTSPYQRHNTVRWFISSRCFSFLEGVGGGQ